jgi:hypothetical protein
MVDYCKGHGCELLESGICPQCKDFPEETTTHEENECKPEQVLARLNSVAAALADLSNSVDSLAKAFEKKM